MARKTLERNKRRRSRNPLPFILAGAGVLLLLLAGIMAFNIDGTSGGTEVALLDGGTVNLEQYEGDVLLVNFWASWCPPCRAEMPNLQAYYDIHQNDGFELLMINSQESEATARSFIEASGFTFPVGLDPAGIITNSFGVTGLPVSIVFDREGEIVYRHSGYLDPSVLEANVTPLLDS